MFWLAGEDSVGKVGSVGPEAVFASVAMFRSVANSDVSPRPIASVLAGTAA